MFIFFSYNYSIQNESRKIGYLNIFIICHHCIKKFLRQSCNIDIINKNKNFQDHSLWNFYVTFHFKTNLSIYIVILN